MKSVRPFVLVNMSMSADGKIATANRAVTSFSSARDQQQLYALRATADAIMCGARTLDTNEIYLGPGPARFRRLRLQNGRAEYPLRVIVTGAGSLDARATIFKKRFSPIIILTTNRAGNSRLNRLRQLADEVKICGYAEIDFTQALPWLRKKWNVKRLLCEGGGELNGALCSAGLVDELHLTICPFIFGGQEAPTLADGLGVSALSAAFPMRLVSCRRRDDEQFLVYRATAA